MSKFLIYFQKNTGKVTPDELFSCFDYEQFHVNPIEYILAQDDDDDNIDNEVEVRPVEALGLLEKLPKKNKHHKTLAQKEWEKQLVKEKWEPTPKLYFEDCRIKNFRDRKHRPQTANSFFNNLYQDSPTIANSESPTTIQRRRSIADRL